MVQPRPLSQLLMTDRDPTSPVYSGIPVHWGMWDVYFPKLICRCAAKAKAKGYNVFGIQHYGRQLLLQPLSADNYKIFEISFHLIFLSGQNVKNALTINPRNALF